MKNLMFWLTASLVLILFWNVSSRISEQENELSFTQFMQRVQEDKVAEVKISGTGAGSEITGQRPEQIELLPLLAMVGVGRHGRSSQRGKRPPAVAGEAIWRLAGSTVPPRGSEVEVTRPRSAQAWRSSME